MTSLSEFNQMARADQITYLVNNFSETSFVYFKSLERIEFGLNMQIISSTAIINNTENVTNCIKYSISNIILIIKMLLNNINLVNSIYRSLQNYSIEILLLEKMSTTLNNSILYIKTIIINATNLHINNADASLPQNVSSELLNSVKIFYSSTIDLINLFELLHIFNTNFAYLTNSFNQLNIILATPEINILSYKENIQNILNSITNSNGPIINLGGNNTHVNNIQQYLNNIYIDINNMKECMLRIINKMTYVSLTAAELADFKYLINDDIILFIKTFNNINNLFNLIETSVTNLSNSANTLNNQINLIIKVLVSTNLIKDYISINAPIYSVSPTIKGYSLGAIQNLLLTVELIKNLVNLTNNSINNLIDWNIDGLVLNQILPQITYVSNNELHIVNLASSAINNAQGFISNLLQLANNDNVKLIANTCQNVFRKVNELNNILQSLCNIMLSIIYILSSFSYLIKILSSTNVDVVGYKNLSRINLERAMNKIGNLYITTQATDTNILVIISRLNNIISEINNMSININRIANEIMSSYLTIYEMNQIKTVMNNEFTKFATSYNLIVNHIGQITAFTHKIYDEIFNSKDYIYNSLQNISNTFGKIMTFKSTEEFMQLSQTDKDEYGYTLVANIKEMNDPCKTIFSQLISLELQMGTSAAIADASLTLIDPSNPPSQVNKDIDIIQLCFENLSIQILKISIYMIGLMSTASAIVINTYTYLVNWEIDDLIIRKILDVFGSRQLHQNINKAQEVINELHLKYINLITEYQVTSDISLLLSNCRETMSTITLLLLTYSKLYIIMSYLVAAFGNLYKIINHAHTNIDTFRLLIQNYLDNSAEIMSLTVALASNNQDYLNIVDNFTKTIIELKVMRAQVIFISNLITNPQLTQSDRESIKNASSDPSLVFATSYNRANHFIAQANIAIENIQNNIYDLNTQLYTHLYRNSDANLFKDLFKKFMPIFTIETLNGTIITLPFIGPRRLMTIIWVGLILIVCIILFSFVYKYFKS